MARISRMQKIIAELQANEIIVSDFSIAKFSQVEDESIELTNGVRLQVGRNYICVNRDTGELKTSTSAVTGKPFTYYCQLMNNKSFRTVSEALPTIRKYLKDASEEFANGYVPSSI